MDASKPNNSPWITSKAYSVPSDFDILNWVVKTNAGWIKQDTSIVDTEATIFVHGILSDPDGAFHGQSNTILLNTLAGGHPCYAFYYNWRDHIDTNGQNLQALLGSSLHVTLIAHSMGGLVSLSAVSHIPDNTGPDATLYIFGSPTNGALLAGKWQGTYTLLNWITVLAVAVGADIDSLLHSDLSTLITQVRLELLAAGNIPGLSDMAIGSPFLEGLHSYFQSHQNQGEIIPYAGDVSAAENSSPFLSTTQILAEILGELAYPSDGIVPASSAGCDRFRQEGVTVPPAVIGKGRAHDQLTDYIPFLQDILKSYAEPANTSDLTFDPIMGELSLTIPDDRDGVGGSDGTFGSDPWPGDGDLAYAVFDTPYVQFTGMKLSLNDDGTLYASGTMMPDQATGSQSTYFEVPLSIGTGPGSTDQGTPQMNGAVSITVPVFDYDTQQWIQAHANGTMWVGSSEVISGGRNARKATAHTMRRLPNSTTRTRRVLRKAT